MKAARDSETFLRAPVGCWIPTESSVIWCASTTLAGAKLWGVASPEDTKRIIDLFDRGIDRLAPAFDLLFDAGQTTRVDGESLMMIVGWVRSRLDEFRRRIRTRVSVLPEGALGVTLAGISPILGGLEPVHLVTDAREAFRLCLPAAEADALHDAIAGVARGLAGAPVIARLAALLDDKLGAIDLAQAARQLAVSPRTLQRELEGQGTSYREIQRDARYRAAETLLAGAEKLSAIAARLGLTEAGLALLVKAKAGVTPGELRKKLQGK